MVDKETDLPDWIESKITMAADYIKCVSDYIEAAEQIGTGLEEETTPIGKVQKIEKKTELVKLHPNGVATDTEEGWAKPKIKEETMKSYKEFLQSLDEKLIGGQKKLDKNHNNELDKEDFELLRKEEADHLLEYTPGPDGKTMIKGRSYGADYTDPEGADETPADMKKKEKAGRKAGQSTGSYKPRKTMSKLKAAGATYK
jgi:hypothetical protein